MIDELKVKHFKYSDDLVKYVNENSVIVVSITSTDRFSEGYVLFYKEN